MIEDMIHSVRIEADEDGWELILGGTEDEYRLNIHIASHELVAEVEEKLGPWVAEEVAAYRERQALIAQHGGVDDDVFDQEGDVKPPRHLELVVNNV